MPSAGAKDGWPVVQTLDGAIAWDGTRVFRLLVATDPTGVVTGFGFCAASAADQQVAETFFAVRHRPNSRLPSVGSAFSSGAYVADKGFEGKENHRRWQESYGVRIIHPPKRNSRKPWPKR